MKQNVKASAAAKKTVARKNVVDAQEQLDAKSNFSTEEYAARVANKAYELFERRGYQHGFDQEDWYQAERLIQEDRG
jgi:hypothetical protein